MAGSGNSSGSDPGERVIARARAHGVSLDADPALVKLLVRVESGEDVPPYLYAAVARILDFAWATADELAGPPTRR